MNTFSASLKNQIARLCAVLIFICSSTIMASFWWHSSRYTEKHIQSEIDRAKNVFEQYLSAKENLLITATEVLTQDFDFKQAASAADNDNLHQALQNHGHRIGADLLLLAQPDGRLLFSDQRRAEDSEAFAASVQELIQSSGSARFIQLHHTLYQVIVLPISTQAKGSYLLVGFKIDHAMSSELKRLTGLEISFLNRDETLLISSLVAGGKAEFDQVLESRQSHFWFWHRQNYVSRSIPINSLSSAPIQIILTASLPKIYAEFDDVLRTTFLWATLTLLIGLYAALRLSRTLTDPLRQLVATAKKFAVGDYRSDLDMNASTSAEVRDLLLAFADMGQQIKAREEQVVFQARHDILTQLYNRNTMLVFINNHIESNKPFLLIASNIRDFKNINDNLGPQIGDECLRAIANRLQLSTSGTQGTHARLGGDEFISLIPVEKLSLINSIANDLLTLLQAPIWVHELHLKLRFCLGVCIFPNDGDDAKTLMRRAIIALEEARKTGLAIRYYQHGEDEAHLARLAVVDDLTKAMHATEPELFMHYQPKLNIKTGRIDKVESLIRWRRPGHGWVSPEIFIGLAEQAGLIIELTHWVVHTVLAQLELWQVQQVEIKAAINISARDLLHPDFVQFMHSAVRRYQIDPKKITLELTERDLMSDEEHGLTVLNQLQAIGFSLSVDDYGIGQSALGKLKKLPVSELKIDKSFILKLDSSPTDQMIVQSTITLGHNLGLSVVAEGVENQVSLELLKKMGIDHIQGNLLSRPISANEFINWLGSHYALAQQA